MNLKVSVKTSMVFITNSFKSNKSKLYNKNIFREFSSIFGAVLKGCNEKYINPSHATSFSFKGGLGYLMHLFIHPTSSQYHSSRTDTCTNTIQTFHIPFLSPAPANTCVFHIILVLCCFLDQSNKNAVITWLNLNTYTHLPGPQSQCEINL